MPAGSGSGPRVDVRDRGVPGADDVAYPDDTVRSPRQRSVGSSTDASRARARAAAVGHSRRVRLLRIALPVIAAVILLVFGGITLVRSLVPGLDISALSLSSEGIVMEHPRLSGHGPDRSYEITADRAIQSLTDPNRIDLVKISAVITMRDGKVVNVSADKGIFDNGKEILKLRDNIRFKSTAGEDGVMSSADIDLKSGDMTTETPLQIKSQTFSIKAGGGESAKNGDSLVFRGGVHVTIDSKAESTSSASKPSDTAPGAAVSPSAPAPATVPATNPAVAPSPGAPSTESRP